MLGFSRNSVSPREAAALLDRGEAIALDVRTPGEWQAGRIPAAVHIPLSELDARAGEIPSGRRVVAFCRSGSRSAIAARAPRKAGHEVDNLSGGLRAWHRAGLPLEPPGGRVA